VGQHPGRLFSWLNSQCELASELPVNESACSNSIQDGNRTQATAVLPNTPPTPSGDRQTSKAMPRVSDPVQCSKIPQKPVGKVAVAARHLPPGALFSSSSALWRSSLFPGAVFECGAGDGFSILDCTESISRQLLVSASFSLGSTAATRLATYGWNGRPNQLAWAGTGTVASSWAWLYYDLFLALYNVLESGQLLDI
jgi:hypothetical protein